MANGRNGRQTGEITRRSGTLDFQFRGIAVETLGRERAKVAGMAAAIVREL